MMKAIVLEFSNFQIIYHLPVVMNGMMDPSTTLKFFTPRTLRLKYILGSAIIVTYKSNLEKYLYLHIIIVKFSEISIYFYKPEMFR